jgi:uncharacterized protein (TIGR00645 family)
MKSLELIVERIILSSRWLLVVFYLGLVGALALYAVSFVYKFYKIAIMVFTYDESDMILAMLGLIDAALVASLIVMVMISGYENFVSRFDEGDAEVSFVGKLDSGSLKIKVASSIVAISSIHLLQIFLNVQQLHQRAADVGDDHAPCFRGLGADARVPRADHDQTEEIRSTAEPGMEERV